MNKRVQNLASTELKIPQNNYKILYNSYLRVERAFERFDFTDEWNNLGYGAITQNSSNWSIADMNLSREGFAEILAEVKTMCDEFVCVFVGIKETDGEAHLVINREAGLVDGIDYWIVEDFLLNYKSQRYGSLPILSEIPYGYKSAVTMRIDCDEDIASGNRLADLYFEKEFPFSMAIKTDQEFTQENIDSMLSVIERGGSIVSHSHTHAPNWGGSREQAKWEAETAREKLQSVLPKDYNYEWVVSPFHQNPQYAVKGLVDAGIKGFVGGIIKNDPEYLQARAGFVSTGENIITHSQQCMLHGDCYHETGLEIYKQSFSNHYNTNTFFGFLDHPFSDYKYGWNDEEERLQAHSEFVDFIKSHDDVWYANLIDAMNFLWVKAGTKIWVENDSLKWELPKHNYKNLPDLKVFWKGKEFKISCS